MRRLLVCRVDPRLVVAHFAESRELVRSSGTGTKKIAQRGMGAPKAVEENLALSASHICSETRGKKIPGGLGLKPITVEQNSHFCPKNIV